MDFNIVQNFINSYSYIIKDIETYAKAFATFTSANPVVGGLFGMWLLGVLTYFFKSVPSKIYGFLRKQFTVTISISSDNNTFHDIIKWYAEEGFALKSRTLRVTSGLYGHYLPEVSAGFGNHYFRSGFRIFKLNRYKEDSTSSSIKEHISFTTISRSQDVVRNLLNTVINKHKEEEKDNILKIYRWNGSDWDMVAKQGIRSLESVVLPKETKDKVINHLKEFTDEKDWYIGNGVPYRTGMMLYGPPGTGKSSFVAALCGHVKKDLFILNLNNLSDATFEKALLDLHSDCIVLIEDFDGFGSIGKRALKVDDVYKDEKNASKGQGSNEESKSDIPFLTLSGVLNAIDGVIASEGRILIATTNAPDKLDAALLRPGRLGDLTLKLDNLTDDCANKMLSNFYPNEILPTVKLKKVMSPAQLQKIIIHNKKDPMNVIEEIQNG